MPISTSEVVEMERDLLRRYLMIGAASFLATIAFFELFAVAWFGLIGPDPAGILVASLFLGGPFVYACWAISTAANLRVHHKAMVYQMYANKAAEVSAE